MDDFGAARVGPPRGRGVEIVLELREQALVGGVVGAGTAGGRHQPVAKLANDFFPELGIVGDRRDIHPGQHEIAGLHPRAVAAGAVAIDERLF